MKVVTFGELMLRLAPENYLRFVQSENLHERRSVFFKEVCDAYR